MRAFRVLATLLVAVAGVVALPDHAGAAGESVYLEHFAGPVGGLPAGWTGSGQVVDDRGYGERGALRVADESATSTAGAQTLVAVAGERSYDLSVYTFTDTAGDGGRIRVVVEQYATASGALGTLYGIRMLDIPVSSTWRLNRLVFTTAYRAKRVRIGLFPADAGAGYTGRAWFDELGIATADGPANSALDATGRPVPVQQVEDVPAAMTPDQFWSRLPSAPSDPAVSGRSLWSYDLLRRHFLSTNVAIPRVADAQYRGLSTRDRTVGVRAPAKCIPDTEGREPRAGDPDPPCPTGYRQVVASADQLVFAGDIAYRPIVSPHPYPTGTYTTEYYARRTHDFLAQLGTEGDASLLPAMVLTANDPRFADLAGRLLDFLRYSQYTAAGDNPFVRDEYPAAFADLQASGLTRTWQGGWPSVFNWSWLDPGGYSWRPHEPDHHVNAEVARAMVRAYEVTGDRAYVDAAAAFVRNQVPRYGWHTGIWDGKRYYWTEYNPSGTGTAHLDAVDNVQALVAQAAAMVGYYTGDRRMLEYARGLLWYCLREFTVDGRWYYDGAENPMNQRAAVSHDMAVLLPLLGAAPYLLQAGVALDTELAILATAYEHYRQTYAGAPFNRIRAGQAVKLAPRWAAGSWQVTSFLTANASGEELVYADTLPSFASALPAPRALDVHITRLLPPSLDTDGWRVDPAADVRVTLTPDELRAGVATGVRLRPGDAVRVSYALPGPAEAAWTAMQPGTFTYVSGADLNTVSTIVPTAAFPTAVTGDNFVDIAAALAFPHPTRQIRG
jgi:hypothetical protein